MFPVPETEAVSVTGGSERGRHIDGDHDVSDPVVPCSPVGNECVRTVVVDSGAVAVVRSDRDRQRRTVDTVPHRPGPPPRLAQYDPRSGRLPAVTRVREPDGEPSIGFVDAEHIYNIHSI